MAHSVSIQHESCITGMAKIKDRSVDALFVDPPYNIGDDEDKSIHYDINAALEAQNWTPFFAGWDAEWKDPIAYMNFCMLWLRECRRILKRKGSIFVCGTYHGIGEIALVMKILGFYTVRWIAWQNPVAMPNRTVTSPTASMQVVIWARPYESTPHIYQKDVAMLYGGGVNLDSTWVIPSDSALAKRLNRQGIRHPSKKPPKLIERALRLSCPKEDAVIVDPFAGSGTTGDVVRAIGHGWTCTLFEKEAEYIPMIEKRMTLPIQLGAW